MEIRSIGSDTAKRGQNENRGEKYSRKHSTNFQYIYRIINIINGHMIFCEANSGKGFNKNKHFGQMYKRYATRKAMDYFSMLFITGVFRDLMNVKKNMGCFSLIK